MVDHGTAKKRRRGVKVTRKKLPVNRFLKISNSVKHKDIRAMYDKKKSPRENMTEFGLVFDANNLNNETKKKPEHPAFLGYATLQLPDDGTYAQKNPKRKPLSEIDSEYARVNIEKHGTNFKAMERDIEVNDRQYTEEKMEKLCNKYLLLANNTD
jgi:hypothetical protein